MISIDINIQPGACQERDDSATQQPPPSARLISRTKLIHGESEIQYARREVAREEISKSADEEKIFGVRRESCGMGLGVDLYLFSCMSF